MVFITGYQSTEVLEPADRSLDFPTSSVTTETSAVLRRRLLAIAPVRADEFYALASQSFAQGIAVGGEVVDQPLRPPTNDALRQQRLNQRHLVRTSAGDGRSQREAATVGEHHDLGSLAAFGLADQFAPFFAEENVPSANVSERSTWPCRSSFRSSRAHAFSQTPLRVHCWKRRQQVAAEGKPGGRSFQRAPLRSTHAMPSKQRRGSIAGRPTWPVRGMYGNKSAINRHWASVSSDLGSILDPAGRSARGSRDRIVISGLLSDHWYAINNSPV